MMKDVFFLTLAEVIDIHSNQMELYGGLPGIRDINLLSSAIAMPHASFHGEYLHNDIYEMAAAYAFHISKNHSFVDGDKRTALVSALVFLELFMESAFQILRGNSTMPCYPFQRGSLTKVSLPVY